LLSLTHKWFHNQEFSFAIGICSITVAITASIVSITVPYIYNSINLGTTYLVGLILCVFSLFCIIALVIIDKYQEKVDGEK
jgi:hypothetical protein